MHPRRSIGALSGGIVSDDPANRRARSASSAAAVTPTATLTLQPHAHPHLPFLRREVVDTHQQRIVGGFAGC